MPSPELQDLLSSGDLTSVQIVETYLAQIEKHNHAGAHLSAIITVAHREIALSRYEDHCWIVLFLEGNCEGECGSDYEGLDHFLRRLSILTTLQLLEQGMIILGTANLSEFCGYKAEEMTPGWSAMGGQTRSAYDLDSDLSIPPNPWCNAAMRRLVVWFSSRNSAGFAPWSLGTETGGSLVYPTSLYAIRPTLGHVPSKGVYRISKSYDGIGAMARTPEDLANLVEGILTSEIQGHLPWKGFTYYMTKSWKDWKIGIADSTWGMSSQETRDKWTSAPVAIYPASLPEGSLKFEDLTMRDIAYQEFNEVSREFCDGFEDPEVRTAKDIVKFNEENAELAMPEPHTNQEELIASSQSALTEERCDKARSEIRRLAGEDGRAKYIRENDLDLIIANSDSTLIYFTACSGYPGATVPLGNLENGQPYGLFLLATTHGGADMFSFMSAFEATFPKVKGPTLAWYF
ncbi:uncharacterized protein PAC_13892 [Phialocephala subalpina]|uniref:Amidase domain-containing protein n=1 Tax=Phialocephala subalpina TaxID=576137 RepID=A0A1L7XG31_9HELO|nr:uncharacterized protein PAC_13892 [Phialocephala subalpina]